MSSSLLDINLNDREELKILADNTECQLRIARAEITPNKNDPSRYNLALTFDVPSEPLADDIRVWIPIPNAEGRSEDPKKYVKQVNRIAEFCQAFSVQMPVEAERLQGLTGWAVLREEPGLNGEPQNSVRRFIVARK